MANEKRLIDANYLRKYQFSSIDSIYDEGWNDAIEFIMRKAPTVDAVEVVHGRWEDNHCTVCGMMPMGEELWECCDFAPPKMEWFMDYCPNCGAKMDGGTP